MAPEQIKVNIFGSEYSLVSEDGDTYVQDIARHVDLKMREIDKSQNLSSVLKIAIMAALNISEELFQERQYREKLLGQLNEEARKMNHLITEILED